MFVKSPLVSVCIPVYNCEKYIAESIKSVLSQKFRDFELLVIDNCSTDSTVNIVESFDDSRIRVVINQTNIGMVGNWNKCLDMALGKYIKILPADDLISEDCLEVQVAAMLESPSAVIVGVSKKIIDENGKSLFNFRHSNSLSQLIDRKTAIKKIVRSGTNLIGEPGAVLIRKSAVSQVGHFDSSNFYVMDVDYWLRLLDFGDYYSIRKPFYSFRINSGSESVGLTKQQFRDFKNFILLLSKKYDFLNPFDVWYGIAAAKILAYARLAVYKLYL